METLIHYDIKTARNLFLTEVVLIAGIINALSVETW